MAYLKVITLGRLGAVEDWSCSVAYRNFELVPAQMTQTMIESLANRILGAVTSSSLSTGLRTPLSTSGWVTGFRVEQRGEDEQLLNVGESAYSSPIQGSGTASKTPQDAIVVSLRTSTPGARGRGRIYWPALGATVGAEFALATPTPAQVAAGAAQYFKLIGDQINAEWAANSIAVTCELAVRSTTDHTSRKVERLQVGSALDTQRRRRDKLTETYAVQSYPPA